jgi:hypothetical protein
MGNTGGGKETTIEEIIEIDNQQYYDCAQTVADLAIAQVDAYEVARRT